MGDGVRSKGTGFRYPPFAKPGAAPAQQTIVAEGAADPPPEDDFPPIEQFLDELPSIDDYLAAESPSADAFAQPPRSHEISAATIEAEGWAVSAWQSYDWGSLSALGRQSSEVAAAESSWNATEWAPSGPSAAEIAAALDAIARQIRSGELAIDQFRGIPPEVAMAAALAAMLRLRG